MSLILDALNKADRDEQYENRVPDLNTQHFRGVAAQRQRWWLVIAAAVAIALISVLAVLVLSVWRQGDVTVISESTKNSTPEQYDLQSTSSQTSPAVSLAQPSRKSEGIASEEVRALYQTQYETVQVIEPEVQAAEIVQPAEALSQSTVDVGLARALWEDSRPKSLTDETQFILPKATAPKPVEEEVDLALGADYDDTLAAYSDLPYLHELSTTMQNSIPTLMYAVHTFEQQSVTINKNVFMVGDDVGGGVIVERILADGLVLNFNSQQFKLAALSSWVNY